MPDGDKKLIIVVDLACATCCTKIQKVLCKIKDKENIKNISYDKEKSEVTIVGSFDPDKLYDKLRCKAGRCCIKDRKKPPPPPPPKPKEEPKVAATANATVNLQYAQVCVICYPYPCRCHKRQPCKEETCGVPSKCNCGGCGTCGSDGGGWCPPQPQICCPEPSRCGGGCGGRCQTRCPEPSRCGGGCGGRCQTRCPGPSCTGCNGCRLRLEQKFDYIEYPHSACTVM